MDWSGTCVCDAQEAIAIAASLGDGSWSRALCWKKKTHFPDVDGTRTAPVGGRHPLGLRNSLLGPARLADVQSQPRDCTDHDHRALGRASLVIALIAKARLASLLAIHKLHFCTVTRIQVHAFTEWHRAYVRSRPSKTPILFCVAALSRLGLGWLSQRNA